MEAWQWWGAKNPEEWPDLLETLMTDARKLLKDFFGHDSFRPEQEAVLRSALNRQDVEIYWPTAAGKSLIYQLVALLSWKRKRGIVIVVEPTIPVKQDQVQHFNARAEEYHRRHGDETSPFQACLLGTAQRDETIIKNAVGGEYCLIYLCPESLTQRYLQAFFPLRNREQVSMFAIDEACYIPLWGLSFRPAFQDLAWLREAYESVPILALSGTAPPLRQRHIQQSLGLRNALRSTRPMFRRNLQLEMHRCETDEEKLKMVLELLEHKVYPAVLYVPTKPLARRVRRRLQKALEDCDLNLNIGYIDGETPPAARASNNLDFQSHRIDLMVATDAYGQGIDKADIRLIVHWEPPVNLEMYVNHIGRAGRDGFTSRCILLYSNSWWTQLFEDGRAFTKELEGMDEEDRKVEFSSRSALKDLVTSRKSCRWQRLLHYYDCADELPREGCGSCDVCMGRYQHESGEDFTVGARLLLLSLQLAETCSKLKPNVDVLDIALGKFDEAIEEDNQKKMDSLRSSLDCRQGQKGFLRELLNLLWTNDFVTKKYAGIDEAKTKRGGSKQLLRFLWFLTTKGTQALKDDAIQLMPSKELSMKLEPGGTLKGHRKADKALSRAYNEFARMDYSDKEAKEEAMDHLFDVLSAAKDAHTKATKTTTKKVLKLSPKPKKTRARSPDLLHVTPDVLVQKKIEKGTGWNAMFKENTEEGKWHCTLAIRSLCAVEAEGSNQAESLKVAWGNCIKQKHRINLQERLWIQELFSELPCVPQDFYFEIVGLGHRRNETVVFVVATLLFPSENSFRGNPCEHWTNAIRSSIAVARKSLASQQLQVT